MATPEQPRRHPRIVVAVRSKTGRYKARVDVTGREGADGMPGVADGARVRVDVGRGLAPQDLATTVAFAHGIRNAAVVQIIGRSPRAVAHAREVFLAVWTVDVPDAQEGPGASATRWAAVMLAQPRENGQGPA
jgi:hypothetical protein